MERTITSGEKSTFTPAHLHTSNSSCVCGCGRKYSVKSASHFWSSSHPNGGQEVQGEIIIKNKKNCCLIRQTLAGQFQFITRMGTCRRYCFHKLVLLCTFPLSDLWERSPSSTSGGRTYKYTVNGTFGFTLPGEAGRNELCSLIFPYQLGVRAGWSGKRNRGRERSQQCEGERWRE